MAKSLLLLTTILFLASSNLTAQKDVSLKIGGSYFINCKRTIAFGEQSVMTVSGDDKDGRKVNFDIFSPEGILEASLNEGKFLGVKADNYVFKTIEDGFTITDLERHRIVLKIIRVENKVAKRIDMHVYADMYLPDGSRFQCTPDDCNVPMMKMMKGATFESNGTAIQLN